MTKTRLHGRRRRRLGWVVGVAAVAATVGLAGGSASAAASVRWYNLDADWMYDVGTLDADFNGYTEQIWFDLDNDNRADSHMYNSVGRDNFLETLTIDLNEDGRWERWFQDTNQRAGFDVLYYDTNGDGYWDLSQGLQAYTFGAPTADGLGNLLNSIARINGTYA